MVSIHRLICIGQVMCILTKISNNWTKITKSCVLNEIQPKVTMQ